MLRWIVCLLVWGIIGFGVRLFAQDEIESRPLGTRDPILEHAANRLLGETSPTVVLWDRSEIFDWHRTNNFPFYAQTNEKAIRFRECKAYLTSHHDDAPDDSLWRCRLASYGVTLIEVNRNESGIDFQALATQLISLYPERRKVISANLDRELGVRKQPLSQIARSKHGR